MVQWENGGPMKILGVQFDYGEKTDYARLASVFEKSVAENCPAAELTILTLDTPRAVKKNKGMTSNYEKFKLWNSFIQDQREGEHVILMDVDMMMLGDMRPAFNEDFDIAITRRTSHCLDKDIPAIIQASLHAGYEPRYLAAMDAINEGWKKEYHG